MAKIPQEENRQRPVKLLIVDQDDIAVIIKLFAELSLKIPSFIFPCTPKREGDIETIIGLCQNQRVTHLIFASLGTQNPEEYPSRIDFFERFARVFKERCPQIKTFLITGAERKQVADRIEKIFHQVIYIEARAIEDILELLGTF